MEKNTFTGNADFAAIEALYEQFLTDGDNLDYGWKKFFEGFEFARKNYSEGIEGGGIPENVRKEFRVLDLINGYRSRGHLFTRTNPVRERRKYSPTLDYENFGLKKEDLETVFNAGSEIGIGPAKLRSIINHLQETYCQSIGVEYRYIRHPEIVQWLQLRMETTRNMPVFTPDEKKQILVKLAEAITFEQFLHTKFTGQKRFSLEGCETLIPALDAAIEKSSDLGVEDVVIGMAHRGRLNVLTSIMKKSYREVFSEFEGNTYTDGDLSADVKYHLGYSSDILTSKGNHVHVSLAANPSHLEAVDPIVEGMARAKIDKKYSDHDKVMPILIHGDASIAGQGVVYEVVQMSQLDAYKTGGTVHIVTNNQIGFTTNYLDGRSSVYCTDVAKVVLAPVFHVNADDVEAVVFTIKLALDFRNEFNRDVFIDLLGYRRYGHNEGDEPKFTQPVLYKIIASHPNPKEIYLRRLLTENYITRVEADAVEKEIKDNLQRHLDEIRSNENPIKDRDKKLQGPWSQKRIAIEDDFRQSPVTAVDKNDLIRAGEAMLGLPPDKKFFTKITRLFEERRKALMDGKNLDWPMGELLAYATLLQEGYSVRFSGQDVERGTFSHRHATVKVEDSEEEIVPLKNCCRNGATFEIYNSHLSEYAVLGFEYGYASVLPDTMVIWEAQFGDFANGAQIIIDQFLSSAENKWGRQNGLVMLLPHGYEGQGPEHSGARMERFLELCAQNNIQVANCSTPANFFHLLRRQMHRDFRKPLVIFTPKSLLRHPRCHSTVDEFTRGGFREIIADENIDSNSVEKILLCWGKIYYDLLEQKEKIGTTDTVIIRIEQMHPFPHSQLKAVLEKYKNVKRFIWVQEEPENMGAWGFLLRTYYSNGKNIPLKCIARPACGSPATGSGKKHVEEQREIVEKAFIFKMG
ncbi:MAG: 2-oxoglutarate dehydrogenase E1 component [Bacteroidetes bacterium]|nr:2-oxoglutarate dehydrogenase E1 component [Bacteroidota bacterium]